MSHWLQRPHSQRNTSKILMLLLTLQPPLLMIVRQLPNSPPQMQYWWRSWILPQQNLWRPWRKSLQSHSNFLIVERETKVAGRDTAPSTIIIVGAVVIVLITRLVIFWWTNRIIKNGAKVSDIMGGLQENKPSWWKADTNNKVNIIWCNYITKQVPTIPEAAVADSGCNSHLIKSSTPCDRKSPTVTGLCVGIPNCAVMQASHNATLKIDHLPVHFQQNKICFCPAQFSQQINSFS